MQKHHAPLCPRHWVVDGVNARLRHGMPRHCGRRDRGMSSDLQRTRQWEHYKCWLRPCPLSPYHPQARKAGLSQWRLNNVSLSDEVKIHCQRKIYIYRERKCINMFSSTNDFQQKRISSEELSYFRSTHNSQILQQPPGNMISSYFSPHILYTMSPQPKNTYLVKEKKISIRNT